MKPKVGFAYWGDFPRGEPPTEGDIRALLGAPEDWEVVVGGGRRAVVLALPPGWNWVKLTARQRHEAIELGHPFFPASVHGWYKLVQHQGIEVYTPEGEVWDAHGEPCVYGYWIGRRKKFEVRRGTIRRNDWGEMDCKEDGE